MKDKEGKFTFLQKRIQEAGWDGWLLYDFKRNNDLACHLLEIPADMPLTRRFFCWIPKEGNLVKIVHRVESHVLAHLPGSVCLYSSYEELQTALKGILKPHFKIGMEYSPYNAIPAVSKVDAGTLELIRSFGVVVESSADVLQYYTSVWTEGQLETHIAAAKILQDSVESAWKFIANAMSNGLSINEVDVQAVLREACVTSGCVLETPPICAVNVNSANPHYLPNPSDAKAIKRGDFVLIDVSCKQNIPSAVYADITRIGVVAKSATQKQQEIFDIVKASRDAAFAFIENRLRLNEPMRGWEVDKVCREVIVNAGYGQYFTHRTGHNIGERDHGNGANIDNFETKDLRLLLPGTCFSIEPGIYLPGEFGLRLEDDVYLHTEGRSFRVTEGMQQEVFSILNI